MFVWLMLTYLVACLTDPEIQLSTNIREKNWILWLFIQRQHQIKMFVYATLQLSTLKLMIVTPFSNIYPVLFEPSIRSNTLSWDVEHGKHESSALGHWEHVSVVMLVQ